MAPKSPYSDQQRKLSAYLFENTPVTCEGAAELIGVPHNTLKAWWLKLPKPPHRGGSGTRPKDTEAAKDALIEGLRAEIDKLRAKLADRGDADPSDLPEIIKELKQQMRLNMSSARVGEIATAIRVCVDILKEEAPSGDEARIIEYYIPAGEERPPT